MSLKLFNPVGWFEIYVDDLERAGRFYTVVMERALSPAPTDGTFQALEFQGKMPSAGAMGALMKHSMRKPSLDGTMVYFLVMIAAKLLNWPHNMAVKSSNPNGPLVITGSLPSLVTLRATR